MVVEHFKHTLGTHAFSDDRCIPKSIEYIRCGDIVQIGDLFVEAFGVTHDAPETLAYRVEHRGLYGGVLTDLGSITPRVLNKMRSLSLLALEFNHDPKMLFEGSYAYSVKEYDSALGDTSPFDNGQLFQPKDNQPYSWGCNRFLMKFDIRPAFLIFSMFFP